MLIFFALIKPCIIQFLLPHFIVHLVLMTYYFIIFERIPSTLRITVGLLKTFTIGF